MATEQQGIMSLPQGGQEAAPQLSIDDSHDAIMGALQDVSPEASGQVQQLMAQLTPMLDQLTDEQLTELIDILQMLQDVTPEEYKQKLQELIDNKKLRPGMLPDEYDPELLSVLGMVCLQARKDRQMGNQREATAQMPQPPATMARGGIAEAARAVAAHGRHGDTMLAHINKEEARMLKKRGGSGTINPDTGLPEFWWGSRLAGSLYDATVAPVVDTVKTAVQKITSTTVGKVLATAALATFIGPGAFGLTGAMGIGAQMGLASAGISALSGGNLKDILRAGATSFLAGALSPVVGGAAGSALGVTNQAAQAALGAGITGAGIGKLTGQSLQESVRSGLTQGVIAGAVNLANAPAPRGEGAPVVDGAPRTVEDIRNEMASGAGNQPTSPTTPPPTASTAPGMTPQGPQLPAAMGPQQGIASLGAEFNQYETPLSKVQNMASSTYEGAKDLYNRYLSPSGIEQQGLADARVKAEAAYQDTLSRTNSQNLAEKAYQSALDANKTGMFAKYGPMVGAGLGVAALTGGFKPTPAAPSALANKLAGTPGEDLVRANPRQYMIQNLPGVQYDQSGYITGGSRWNPAGSVEDVRQPMPGTASTFMPSMYTPPQGALGQQPQIAQPYNTASMYGNLFQPMDFVNRPRFAADGGLMEMQDADGGPVNFQAPPSEGGMGDRGIAQAVPHLWSGGSLFSGIRQIFSSFPGLSGPAGATPVASTTPVASMTPATTVSGVPAVAPGSSSVARPAPTLGTPSAGISSLAARMYPSLYNPQFQQMLMGQNRAGLASFAEGGYPRRTGQISGPGTETSDSIPAMLSDGEFVMTAKAVRGAGKGDRRAGAKKMYALMHQLERNASRG